MAIVNITTDSFFDGGSYTTEESLIKRVEQQLSDGATIIDIGACSTRPGAAPIDQESEIEQIRWATKILRREFSDITLSIDTFRSKVAECGADIFGEVIVNDIYAGEYDKNMVDFVTANKFPYIVMHYTQSDKNEDITSKVIRFFHEKRELLTKRGVEDLILDVGFGFGKSLEENFEIVNNFDSFSIFDNPLLVGVSRKSMICRTLNISPSEALNGTTVINTILATKGANIFRVHDAKEALDVVKLVEKVC